MDYELPEASVTEHFWVFLGVNQDFGDIKNGLGAKESAIFSYLIAISVKETKHRLILIDHTVKTITLSMQLMGEYCMLPNPESTEDFVRIHSVFYENLNVISSKSFIKKTIET